MAKHTHKKLVSVKSLLEMKRSNSGVEDPDFFLAPSGMTAKPPEKKSKKKKDLLKQGARNISGGAARRNELLRQVIEEI